MFNTLKIISINHHKNDEPYCPLNSILYNNSILKDNEIKLISTALLKHFLNKKILKKA